MSSNEHSHHEPIKPKLSRPAARSFRRSMRIRLNQVRFYKSTSAPFISGDSIASLTNYYVYGKNGNKPLNLKKLRKSKSVFVNSHKLVEFFSEIEGFELGEITLVTGNSDLNFIEAHDLPDEIMLWLCQNNAMPDKDNLVTLPIGIENVRLGRLGLPKWYSAKNKNCIQDKILVPPMAPTNPSRFLAVELAKSNPKLFDVFTDYLFEDDYFNLTHKYSFVLCCEGNGFDSHRLWETLYQDSFPVMVRTPWAKSLEYLNLPILFVDSLDELTHETLAKFVSANSDFSSKNCPQLWTPFWKSLIRSQSLSIELG